MSIAVNLTDSGVEIGLTGFDALWSLRGSLQIPWSEILEARVVDGKEARRRLRWKTGGLSLPGVANAGNFTVRGKPGAREFWATYRDPDYLEITTTRDRPYRIVLQHPDRVALAAAISTTATGR